LLKVNGFGGIDGVHGLDVRGGNMPKAGIFDIRYGSALEWSYERLFHSFYLALLVAFWVEDLLVSGTANVNEVENCR
jgi:hypothetical protein